ncbi:hypothetical protein ACFOU2_25080 [Bacillus songklensis]|uniref:Transposase n=1 Tax=Bacillus songklensis TaxID=1069116 RepID=A0ABV8BAY3_9BACI
MFQQCYNRVKTELRFKKKSGFLSALLFKRAAAANAVKPEGFDEQPVNPQN